LGCIQSDSAPQLKHILSYISDICCFQHSRASTVEKQLLTAMMTPLLLKQNMFK